MDSRTAWSLSSLERGMRGVDLRYDMRAIRYACLIGFAAVFMLANGCARIVTNSYNEDKFLRLEIRDTPPEGGASITTDWRFDGDVLVVNVDRWHTCHRYREKLFERTRITEKRINDSQHMLNILLGALLLPAGVVITAMPDKFVAEDAEDPEASESGWLAAGVITAGAGTGFLVTALIDGIRAKDKKKKMGVVRRKVGKEQVFYCREDTGTGLEAALEIPGVRETLKARVGPEGRVSFDLSDLLGDKKVKAGFATLTIGNRTESIPLLMSPGIRKRVEDKLGGAQ